ncbi:MAG: D-alanyl-D-alanine carboxypeptidase family protein [Clostridia bacterium]|nr:D-alanyl-D-alanine carboxypeptidase family protein [Clostridia bacterium]MBR1585629.1 D-alanyl-D-alanine carboxypeptidase family protein [Clostridia bacterium]
MPQRKTRRKQRSPYLFMALAVILLVVGLVIGSRAMNAWNAYTAAAAVTPTPSPTVRPIAVTQAPDLVTFTPPPTATPGPLSSGASGERVTQLQQRLKELGFYQGSVDGQFGSGTKSAVRAFQKQHGLDDDGIAGAKTLAVLYSDQAAAYQPTPTPKVDDTLAGDIPLLVNKWNKLPDDFVPADLVTIRDVAGDLLQYDDKTFQGVREAVDALVRMIQAAKADGITPWKVGGAYRTIKDQQRIFNNRVSRYMQNDSELTRSQAISRTRLTVADPGCSEHHTGLAFDLNVPNTEAFVDTAQYLWLNAHCWDYGFIMRYTDEKEDITGIIGEEWHVRYVGIDHAHKMRELDYCLEEYVEYLKQQLSNN